MLQRGRVKAEVLRAIYLNDLPTIPAIEEVTDIPASTIKDCISRLLVERNIEKLNFCKEGMDGQDYRRSFWGRRPRFFYELKPRGMKKLQYFKKIGLIDL